MGRDRTRTQQTNPLSLSRRVQRKVERARVWRPDAGSVTPRTVARFTGSITERLIRRGPEQRRWTGDAQEPASSSPDLVLAPPSVALGLEPEPSASVSLPESTARPAVVQREPVDLPSPVLSPATGESPQPAYRRAREAMEAFRARRTGERPAPDKTQAGEGPVQPEPRAEAGSSSDRVVLEPALRAEPAPLPGDVSPTVPVPPKSSESPDPPGLQDEAPAQPPADTIVRRATSRARPGLIQRRPAASRRATPPLINQQEAGAYLATRGWRFKRKVTPRPASADRVRSTVDRLERGGGPGRPLADEPRMVMEQAFDRDFGDVRIHRTPLGPLDVEAATRGQDVHVEPGQDQFDTPESMALLGHELTHVSQAGPVGVGAPVQREVATDESMAEGTEMTLLNLFRSAPSDSAAGGGPGTSDAGPSGVIQRASAVDDMTASMEEEGADDVGEEVERETAEWDAFFDEELEEEEPEPVEVNLDQLARQVYPFVKRLLAVERERMVR